jgi:glutaredoxin 3
MVLAQVFFDMVYILCLKNVRRKMPIEIKSAPKVLLFTTPTCHYCTVAKRYFKEQRIKFREIDISRNPNAAADIQRKTGQTGVPVIVINSRPIVGFDKVKINKLLGLK